MFACEPHAPVVAVVDHQCERQREDSSPSPRRRHGREQAAGRAVVKALPGDPASRAGGVAGDGEQGHGYVPASGS